MSMSTRSGRALTPSKKVLDAVEDIDAAPAPKRARAASGKSQQQSRDLSREALDLAARDFADHDVFLTSLSPKPTAVDSYAPPAPAAAAAGSNDVALQQVLHILHNVQSEQRNLRVQLEKQQDKAVPTPTVPAAVTSVPLQEVGKAVEAMTSHMRTAETGEFLSPKCWCLVAVLQLVWHIGCKTVCGVEQ